MSVYDKYELVVGLEIHAQLSTQSKAFCADKAVYGASPNTCVSFISAAHPGALPVLNEKVIEYAVKLGYAAHCEIHRYNEFARKNYFYADLPKGYQITQFEHPICTGGYIDLDLNNNTKRIGITRIHIEEDAGKSTHDQDPYYTLVDLNRAGVALVEIVSEPDIRTSIEAVLYLNEIRKLVRYLDICDGNMEEGSMRCDANISVRIKGEEKLGQRTEIKNINSIKNVRRAIEFEFKRQIDAIESGLRIVQETRKFNALDGSTESLRSKENAHDYRYFPEPDLPPVFLTTDYLEQVESTMPTLPKALIEKYVNKYKLSLYDAHVITEEKEVAHYFDMLVSKTSNYKAAANWIIGPIKSYLNEHAIDIRQFNISPNNLAGLIALIEQGKTNFSVASQRIFPLMIKYPDRTPLEIAEQNGLIQTSDEEHITEIIKGVLKDYPDKVTAYKKGKKGLLGMFMGQVMKRSKGKADPKISSIILEKKLNE